MTPTEWIVLGGLGTGLLYGMVAQISGFCLNSAIRNQVRHQQGDKLRSFLLAMVVALVGTQVITHAGLVDTSESIYASSRVSWVLTIFGGLLFGYGMILARGCGARTLVLLGQGNLRSLVVLLCLGISAYATLSGVLGPLRNWVNEQTVVNLDNYTFESTTLRWSFVILFCLVFLFYILKDKGFLKQSKDLFSGVAVGLLIVVGWLVTGWLGLDEFEPTPPASLTFVAPIGATIQYIMIATGASLNFGIVVVLGVIAGSFLSAVLTRQFQITGFDETLRMPRYIAGGVLMGIGGALAMGCSIGQGLTGFSTLSFMSLAALISIVFGARLALLHKSTI